MGTGSFDALKSVLEPQGHSVPGQALIGNWHCRNMKMGGVDAYIVYNWFSCRVGVINGALFSKRPMAAFARKAFSIRKMALGSIWARRAQRANLGIAIGPRSIAGRTCDAGRSNRAAHRDRQQQVAIEIPGPVEESTYDIIELAR